MWVYIWLLAVFVVGACVGSLVNVCVYRLPTERSILWPGSRCGRCLYSIRWYDNIPLVSYWVLRGRCRNCGERFSIRYFMIELLTGLGYAGVFYLTVHRNVLAIPPLDYLQRSWAFAWGWVPLEAWAVWFHFTVLFTFLLIVSLCDWDEMEIPMGVPLVGTVVGLLLAMLFAWPYPNYYAPSPYRWLPPTPGIYAWPLWSPLPAGLDPGSWKLGLYTGLAGAFAGAALIRGIRFVFSQARGIEGLGLGDADLMMMAGAFVGWQPVVTACFVAVPVGLVFGLIQLFRKGDHPLPFGPSLAAGVLVTVFFWPVIGRWSWAFFSDSQYQFIAVGMGAFLLLVSALLLRLMRGVPTDRDSARPEDALAVPPAMASAPSCEGIYTMPTEMATPCGADSMDTLSTAIASAPGCEDIYALPSEIALPPGTEDVPSVPTEGSAPAPCEEGP